MTIQAFACAVGAGKRFLLSERSYGMKKHLSLFLVALLATFSLYAQTWEADSLPGYVHAVINQPDGRRCVVVRKTSPKAKGRAVLYVHGYNDYFFQAEMGDTFVDSCYSFFAVDLRGYGRAIEPGETPYQAKSVSDYYADLDTTIAIMHREGIDHIALMGHSTGGLITSCYLNTKPREYVDCLILNSPFLAWNFNGFMRNFAIPVASCIGELFPRISIKQSGDEYGKSLSSDFNGRWHFNVEWKTIYPRRITLGWVHMIQSAQMQLRHHTERILVPILLMHSDKSFTPKKWSDDIKHTDVVLNVSDISKYGRTLGPSVTELTVNGGIHDLFLSDRQVTDSLYKAVFDWMRYRM